MPFKDRKKRLEWERKYRIGYRKRNPRQHKSKYLGMIDCPKCGKHGRLEAFFVKERKSWYFDSFHVTHYPKTTHCRLGKIAKGV